MRSGKAAFAACRKQLAALGRRYFLGRGQRPTGAVRRDEASAGIRREERPSEARRRCRIPSAPLRQDRAFWGNPQALVGVLAAAGNFVTAAAARRFWKKARGRQSGPFSP